MSKAILYPYQRRWIDDASPFKIGMFARQTGKTFTTTLEIAEDVVKAELQKRKTRWVILSRGERQAREAMDEGLKLHLRALGVAFEAVGTEFALSDNTRVKALEVETRHGSRVTALPANADTARGFSANVFLDEFAFHQDSYKIWSALFPVVSKPGLKLRVCSTPNGRGNKFAEIIADEANPLWSRHIVDIYAAVKDGLDRDIDVLKAGCADELTWRQEYELDMDVAISDALVFRDRYAVQEFTPPSDARFYYGCDWGFATDPTVLLRCYLAGDVAYIDHEAWQTGCELENLPRLFDQVPEARRWTIQADSARPEIIRYMRRQGFIVRPAKKWQGSIEEGVLFLRSLKKIIVHPRCQHVINELKSYSYKVDRATNEVLPRLEDKNNHCIDALRYALENVTRNRRKREKV